MKKAFADMTLTEVCDYLLTLDAIDWRTLDIIRDMAQKRLKVITSVLTEIEQSKSDPYHGFDNERATLENFLTHIRGYEET